MPYTDAKGNKTIGWGHKVKQVDKVSFKTREVDLNSESITVEEAKDIQYREGLINDKLVEGGIEYEVNQLFYDALFDLIYQSGEDHLNDQDLGGFLQAGEFDLRNKTMIIWQFGEFYGNGSAEDIMNDIKRRRLDELDIIFKGDYDRDYGDDLDRYGSNIWGVLSAMAEGKL